MRVLCSLVSLICAFFVSFVTPNFSESTNKYDEWHSISPYINDIKCGRVSTICVFRVQYASTKSHISTKEDTTTTSNLLHFTDFTVIRFVFVSTGFFRENKKINTLHILMKHQPFSPFMWIHLNDDNNIHTAICETLKWEWEKEICYCYSSFSSHKLFI